MAFVVVYDASVLYPNTLRDLLIRIAQAGLCQAKWTEQILDEVFTSLRTNRPDLDSTALDRTRSQRLASLAPIVGMHTSGWTAAVTTAASWASQCPCPPGCWRRRTRTRR